MPNRGTLDGCSIIVTGGGRGIGAGITRVLARAGAKVLIFHPQNGFFDEKAYAAEVVAEVESNGGEAEAYCVDLSERGEIVNAVTRVVGDHAKIDGLVNNAGICNFAPFFEITPENWERHLAVNLSGPFFLSQAVARQMEKRGKGSIVNISTVSAFRGGDRQVHYIASKGGLNSMTTSMAHELRDLNIRVNAILVGGVATDINVEQMRDHEIRTGKPFKERPGIRSLGEPEDIGNAARYLLSDESEWVTGSLMAVDGGALIG